MTIKISDVVIKLDGKVVEPHVEEKPHHYFGTSCYNWAKGQTVEEVLVKLGELVGTSLMKTLKKSNSEGFYVWVCKVNVPQSTPYALNFYQPQGVEVLESWEFNLMNAKGHCLPITKVES